MEKLAEFISAHMSDDTSRLLLARSRWPDIDMDLAVNCIESRRKLKGKVQEWYEEPRLIFPVRLSAEQCSSSATACYKAALAEHIVYSSDSSMNGKGWRIADLTGGLGVDSWYFSKRAEQVFYNEMQTALCEAARHNFKILDSDNISVSNHMVDAEEYSPSALLESFSPDIIYIDPARRNESGRKVFLIEECTPDVLTLKDDLFTTARHLLIKLSPMADITMVCKRLGSTCREVHVVAYGGECKELLIWMDREWDRGYSVIAVELQNDYPASEPYILRFNPSQEPERQPQLAVPSAGMFLFEPGKALMKAGRFNILSEILGLCKLGKSTHYYIHSSKEKLKELMGFGKSYRILRCTPLDKRNMKEAGKDFPKADVTARNIPMDTETLRKKTGVTSGDDAHIFGLRSDLSGNLLLCTKRVFEKDLKAYGNKDEASGKFSL